MKTSSGDTATVQAAWAKLEKARTAKKAKAVWKKFSASTRRLVLRDAKGTVRTRFIPATHSDVIHPDAAGPSCWTSGVELDHLGGITKQVYARTTQETEVCVQFGQVVSVAVTDSSGEPEMFTILTKLTSLTQGTKNVRWEGRALARATYVYGYGDFVLYRFTDCPQARLNADMHSRLALASCDLSQAAA